ncbi:MAG: oxidase, partial [Betaproteobacteria bacterium]
MPSRRDILKATGGLVLATGGSWLASHAHGAVPNPPGLAPLPAGAVASGDLEALAGKLPLIKRSWRPPNYETPLSYFSEE